MRRRRLIKGLVIFGLLGAIANLAVAWTIAYRTMVPSPSSAPLNSVRIERWPVPAAADWPRTAMVIDRWVSQGIERKELSAGARTVVTNPPGSAYYSMDVTLAGWPLHSFAAARAKKWQGQSAAANQRSVTNSWGLAAGGRPQQARFGGRSPSLLPLYPQFPGFLVNTVLYGIVMWLLIMAPMTIIRRCRRRRDGWCLACGYDLRGLSHERCPECGAAIQPLL